MTLKSLWQGSSPLKVPLHLGFMSHTVKAVSVQVSPVIFLLCEIDHLSSASPLAEHLTDTALLYSTTVSFTWVPLMKNCIGHEACTPAKVWGKNKEIF